ncbi:MAG: tripartite tricarboxylate transporter substrate binding protein [Desulfobacteraceae bacterium]|nr:MAG: tripartite tricarboxylate transporter substrate binding protein [Desulfobacteraceae bacterium]
MKTKFMVAWAVLTFSMVALSAAAVAAEYPDKTINLYCCYAPGGTVDSGIRALCTGAEQVLGQNIVIVNKDGGTGTLGLAALAGEKPDGYTLASTASAAIMRVPLTRKMSYKPLASFTNIYAFAGAASGLLVRPDSPFKTFKDLLEHARKNPGKVTYSTLGAGSVPHILMQVIAMKEKIDWVHVPYKGTAPAETAALGGHVDAVSAGDVNKVLGGQMRALLMHTKDRFDRLPDVPTTMELYGVYNDSLFAVYGPAGMDPAVVKKLEDAFAKSQEMPSWKPYVERFGVVSLKMRSAEYTKFLHERWDSEVELEKMLGLIKEPATEPK